MNFQLSPFAAARYSRLEMFAPSFFIRFQNAQPILLTDAVAECAQFCQRSGILAQLHSVFVMHGVDDKVVVIVSGIAVGRHYNFKTPAPQLLRQPDADLMGCLRRDLIRFEGLIPVVAYPAPPTCPTAASLP